MPEIKVKAVPSEPENSKVIYMVESAIHHLVDGDYRKTGQRPSAKQIVARIAAIAEEVTD